jgi:uncharacterized membrane protein YhaH (DUF805 family)
MEWMLMPYRRYADFQGRSRRREYWMFLLFYVLVYIALSVAFGSNEAVRTPTGFGYGSRLVGGAGLVGGLFALFSFVPSLALSVRRLHDQDRSGWLMLLALIPLLGGFALFVLMCLEGTRGPNRYGPDPKDPSNVDVFR